MNFANTLQCKQCTCELLVATKTNKHNVFLLAAICCLLFNNNNNNIDWNDVGNPIVSIRLPFEVFVLQLRAIIYKQVGVSLVCF